MSDEQEKIIFSQQLNYYLNKNNKTQSDLVEDLNLNKSTVSTWCTGSKMPRMGTIQLLANYFGIKKSDLIEDRAEIQKEQDELQEYLEELKNRPEMRMLFQLSKDATKEDVEKAVAIIEALKGK